MKQDSLSLKLFYGMIIFCISHCDGWWDPLGLEKTWNDLSTTTNKVVADVGGTINKAAAGDFTGAANKAIADIGSTTNKIVADTESTLKQVAQTSQVVIVDIPKASAQLAIISVAQLQPIANVLAKTAVSIKNLAQRETEQMKQLITSIDKLWAEAIAQLPSEKAAVAHNQKEQFKNALNKATNSLAKSTIITIAPDSSAVFSEVKSATTKIATETIALLQSLAPEQLFRIFAGAVPSFIDVLPIVKTMIFAPAPMIKESSARITPIIVALSTAYADFLYAVEKLLHSDTSETADSKVLRAIGENAQRIQRLTERTLTLTERVANLTIKGAQRAQQPAQKLFRLMADEAALVQEKTVPKINELINKKIPATKPMLEMLGKGKPDFSKLAELLEGIRAMLALPGDVSTIARRHIEPLRKTLSEIRYDDPAVTALLKQYQSQVDTIIKLLDSIDTLTSKDMIKKLSGPLVMKLLSKS